MIPKPVQTELLLGCAKCGRRFIDAKSVATSWKRVKYLAIPNSVTIDKETIFVCDRCLKK
jgi:hypothetical protein